MLLEKVISGLFNEVVSDRFSWSRFQHRSLRSLVDKSNQKKKQPRIQKNTFP